MRNYLKMRAIWIHGQDGATTAELVSWAGNDEKLLAYINPKIAEQRASNPNMIFTGHGPFDVWFLLDEDNFAVLLNGPQFLLTQQMALAIWQGTRLPDLNVGFRSDFLHDTTRTIVEGSPRKSWSHGH